MYNKCEKEILCLFLAVFNTPKTMRQRYFFTMVAVAMFALSCMAKQRTLEEMTKIANSIIVGKKASKSVPARQQSWEICKTESQITVLENGAQFFVFANDDNFDAVLAHADTGFDDYSLQNPGLAWWMESINQALEEHMSNGTRPQKIAPSKEYSSNVDALLKTEWGQSAPYYNQTPTYTDKGTEMHFVTGCVATAMAQIMKYYNYPATGKGSLYYRCNMETPEGTVTKRIGASFASGNYDWSNMLDSYKGSYSEVQADAVAKLMYHCGVSVQMNYDRDGSGSTTFAAMNALSTYFLYDANLHFYYRDYMNVAEWMDIIFKNLSEGHPILYGGQSRSGGHEFVIDGYDENGLVHVNWGWEGKSNGYFDIASLNGYSTAQDMTPVLMPDNNSYYKSLFGHVKNPTFSLSAGNINASAEMSNLNPNDFSGYVALIVALVDGNSDWTVLSQATGECKGFGVEMYIWNINQTFKSVSLQSLKDGNYRVFFATKDNKDREWQPVRSVENMPNSALLTIVNGKATITGENDSSWTDIDNISISDVNTLSTPIYSISGIYVGTSLNGLPKGLYIINGKKVIK